MRRTIVMASLAAALAAGALAAPDEASASCRDRKVTGTVLGGVGGALLGNAISDGGGGAVIGGVGGAVVGHEIGRRGCNRARPAAYRERPAYRSSSRRSSYASRPAEPRPVRYVYYDQYGQPIASGPAPAAAGYTRASYGYGEGPSCRTEVRRFYDERGLLVERPIQTCDR